MVKLHWLMSLAAAGLFTACSQDELVKDAGNDTGLDGVQEISLMVDNGGDNFGSRGGRPLYSHEAKQNIDEVYVWIVGSDGNVAACTTITNWNDTSTSTIYNEGSHGRKYNQKLILGDATKNDPNMPKLDNGNYTIYALGRTAEKSSSYENFTLPTKGQNFDAKTFKLSLKENVDEVEEIFATSVDVQVKGKGGFNKPVILNRQVAGFYAYLSNIPYDEAMVGRGADPVIKIVASQDKNTLLGFGKFANQDIANEGFNAAMYVVNGATNNHATDNVICTINLNSWFNTIQDIDNDGLIDIDKTKGNPVDFKDAKFDNWKNPYKNETSTEANFTKGSVFGGVFVIPFLNSTATNTLTMQLLAKSTDSTPVETWNIKLPQKDVKEINRFVWNTSAANLTEMFKSEKVTETKDKYSIYRNHLYAIGTKGWDKNPNPGPGPDPNPDPNPDPDPTNPTDPDNKPQPINKTQELTLQVCDNWEVLHEMELE